MKKYILFSVFTVLIILAAMTLVSHFSVPEHIRKQTQDVEKNTVIHLNDERVKAALEAGKNYIMEEMGVDIPFSTDLLRTVEMYFSTDLEFWGAGLYHGSYKDTISIELLLNPLGNVGSVQMCITEQATTEEITEAIMQYAGFINRNLENKEKEAVAREALPHLQELKSGEAYVYYGHETGFRGEVKENQLYIYVP